MSTFTQTIKPWLLTPKVARSSRRPPRLMLSPMWLLLYVMAAAVWYMLAYSLTLTWDFGVVVYVGAGYAIVRLVRRLRRRPAVV